MSNETYIEKDILELDLDCIACKACIEENWSIETTDRVQLEYRAFLQVIRNNDPSFRAAPSRRIDIFWHYHILDTQLYMQHCSQIFGRYVHHFPYSGLINEDAEETQEEFVETTKSAIEKLIFNHLQTFEKGLS